MAGTSNPRRIGKYFAARLITAILVIAATIVTLQDVLVFPSAEIWLRSRPRRDPNSLSPGVESIMLPISETQSFETWRISADPLPGKKPRVAIYFHGNGEVLYNNNAYQGWLRYLGITSYAIDYPGYGLSSGWPSEEGIYKAAETVWKYAVERDKPDPHDMVFLGVSMGTGPATYLASQHNPKALVLVSPYTSIDDVVAERGLFRYLAPLLRTHFPSKKYITQLTDTCVVALHGNLDTVIHSHHSEDLKALYHGDGGFHLITDPDTGHDDVFWKRIADITTELQSCLGT